MNSFGTDCVDPAQWEGQSRYLALVIGPQQVAVAEGHVHSVPEQTNKQTSSQFSQEGDGEMKEPTVPPLRPAGLSAVVPLSWRSDGPPPTPPHESRLTGDVIGKQ